MEAVLITIVTNIEPFWWLIPRRAEWGIPSNFRLCRHKAQVSPLLISLRPHFWSHSDHISLWQVRTSLNAFDVFFSQDSLLSILSWRCSDLRCLGFFGAQAVGFATVLWWRPCQMVTHHPPPHLFTLSRLSVCVTYGTRVPSVSWLPT